ncbi:hypothetical protein Pelo_9640 [Pelomyxa schiedti]|nr:hypothetical protein Pelo_9640 [Pelomyxa schiedti]
MGRLTHSAKLNLVDTQLIDGFTSIYRVENLKKQIADSYCKGALIPSWLREQLWELITRLNLCMMAALPNEFMSKIRYVVTKIRRSQKRAAILKSYCTAENPYHQPQPYHKIRWLGAYLMVTNSIYYCNCDSERVQGFNSPHYLHCRLISLGIPRLLAFCQILRNSYVTTKMEGSKLEARGLVKLYLMIGKDGTHDFVGAPPLWARDQILPLVAARAAATSAAALAACPSAPPAPCPAASPLSPAARSGPPLFARLACPVANVPMVVLRRFWREWIVGARKTVCLQVSWVYNAYVIFDISNTIMGLLTGLKMVSISPDRSLRQFRDVNFPLPQHREYRQALRNQRWCVFRDHPEKGACPHLFVCKLVQGNIEGYLALQYPALVNILSMEFEANGSVLDICYADEDSVFCTYLDLNEVWNERQIMQLPNCSQYSTVILGMNGNGKGHIQLAGGIVQFTARFGHTNLVEQRLLDYNRGFMYSWLAETYTGASKVQAVDARHLCTSSPSTPSETRVYEVSKLLRSRAFDCWDKGAEWDQGVGLDHVEPTCTITHARTSSGVVAGPGVIVAPMPVRFPLGNYFPVAVIDATVGATLFTMVLPIGLSARSVETFQPTQFLCHHPWFPPVGN